MISRYEYVECDICGTKVRKKKTIIQDGLRRCNECIDEKPKIKPLKWSWGSGRANYNTTTAVNTATTYSITAIGGITPSHSISTEVTYGSELGISNIPSCVIFGSYYYMKVVGSGGAVDITANPQISDGVKGDRITLEGTSDTNTITLENGNGLSLMGGESMVLKDGDKITLFYSGTDWVEVSRYEETDYN